jgi:hypothetical protein
MQINNELLHEIERAGLDKSSALLFCFAIEYKDLIDLDKLLELGIIEADKEHFYRINLVNQDVETSDVALRIPLFGHSTKYNSRFSEFVNRLCEDPEMSVNGHVSNIKDYVVIATTKEAKLAFDNLGELDMDKLIEVTKSYYRDTVYCTVLQKYLESTCKLMYDNYKEEKTTLI